MAKSKKELKERARKKASQGKLSGKLVNKLKKAGVNKKVVNNIKTANSEGYAANRAQQVFNNRIAQDTAKASRPNPSKPANHWSNYDYGSSFSNKDVKDLQKGGEFKNNQIMKIAQAAYAGGDVKKVNKLNELMLGLNSQYTNPQQNTSYVKGQKRTSTVYSRGKMPRRVFSWNGFGNGMTINTMSGANEGFKYQPTSVWSLPTKFMGGIGDNNNNNNDNDLNNNNNNNNNDNGDDNGDDNGTTTTTTGPVEPVEPIDTSLSSGAGGLDLASGATGFRRARSSRQRAGRRAQGLASQKKSPFKSWNQ